MPRQKPGSLDYHRRLPLQLATFAVLAFLYLPLIVLVVFSFNDSKRNIVWRGFTLRFYEQMIANDVLVAGFVNSLVIAALATLASLVLGCLAAIFLWRFDVRWKSLAEGAIALPIVVPEIAMGVALLVFFSSFPWLADFPWPWNLLPLIAAHATFCFPFVVTIVRARLATFQIQQLEAALDLGASEARSIFDVVVPHLHPALVAGGLLSFTLSLDDFVITYFTSAPDTPTFPVVVYSMVRFSVTPEVNAASTILLVLTVLLTGIALVLQNRNQIGQVIHE